MLRIYVLYENKKSIIHPSYISTSICIYVLIWSYTDTLTHNSAQLFFYIFSDVFTLQKFRNEGQTLYYIFVKKYFVQNNSEYSYGLFF